MRLPRLLLAALPTLGLGFAFVGLPSCSSPVPPVQQAAWSVSLIRTDSNCGINNHNAALGSVTADMKDALVADGAQDPMNGNTSVSCSIVGTNNFKVDARATQGDKGLTILIDSISATATADHPATGIIAYSSVSTGGLAYSASKTMPCDFYFNPMTGEGIASGRLWVAFTCPVVTSAMSMCELKQGYAIFENCAQVAAPAM